MQGSIEKRNGPQGVAYRVRVEYPRDPVTGKRRQRSESFPTRKAAEAARARWVAEIDRGTAVDTSAMTVAEFLRHWLDAVARHRVRATTLEDYEATITKHIVPALGGVKVQRLTPAIVQKFYADKLAAGCGARTVQLCHLRLSQALKQGVRWGTVARNACDAVEPPRATPRRGKTWTPTEARRFLAAADADGYHPLWLLALSTGARQGELLGLRWQDADLARGTLAVRQCVVVCRARVAIQPPKSDAALRTILLPPEAVQALREHKKRQNEERLIAGPLWTDGDLIFATPLGAPLHPSNVLRNYAKIVLRAGVPRIRFHDMRHSHATWLIADGHPITAVSERLGHAKTSITLDTYAHVVAASRDRAADAMSVLLFAGPDAEQAVSGS